jgi:hypothetical protein
MSARSFVLPVGKIVFTAMFGISAMFYIFANLVIFYFILPNFFIK